MSWGVAFSMYSVILGHLGTDAVAANSLVIVVRNFGTILCFGSAARDRAVAMATPVAPRRGAPNRPKINTAFRKIFSVNAITFSIMGAVTLPTLLRTAR